MLCHAAFLSGVRKIHCTSRQTILHHSKLMGKEGSVNLLTSRVETKICAARTSGGLKSFHTTAPCKLTEIPVLVGVGAVCGLIVKKALPAAHRTKFMGALAAVTFVHFIFCFRLIEYDPRAKRYRLNVYKYKDTIRSYAELFQETDLENIRHKTLPLDHHSYERIRRIMRSIIEANREDILNSEIHSWTIYVVKNPRINANVLPTGVIIVNTGLLKVCSNDDMLGSVLAHEVAHVILNHTGEMFSMLMMVTVPVSVIFGTLWVVLPPLRALFSQLCLQMAYTISVFLPFARQLELEADAAGLNIAAKACFDVRELKHALHATQNPANEMYEMLQTHPSVERRMKSVDALMPDALRVREMCKCPPLDPGYAVFFRLG